MISRRATAVGVVLALASALDARAGGESVRMNVSLQYHEGGGVAAASITVVGPVGDGADAWAFRESKASDETGHAEFTLPHADEYEIQVFKEGHRSFTATANVKTGSGAFVFQTFLRKMPVYGIDVLVTGSDGRPVEAVRVAATGPATTEGPSRTTTYAAMTDALGRARFNAPAPGEWMIALKTRLAAFTGAVTAADPGTRVEVAVRLGGDDTPESAKPREPPPKVLPPVPPAGMASDATPPPPTMSEASPPDDVPAVRAPPGTEPEPLVAKRRPRPATPPKGPVPAAGPGGQQTPPEAGGSATPPKPAEPAARPPDDSATPPPAVDFTGHWEHASGLTFSLTQTGAEVTGAWDGFSSTIRGTVRGAVLEWTTVSAEGVEYHGTATLAAGGKAISGEGTAVKPDSQRGRRFRLDADRLP